MDYKASIEKVHEHLDEDRVEQAVMACFRIARNLKDPFNSTIFLQILNPQTLASFIMFAEDTINTTEEEQGDIFDLSVKVWASVVEIPVVFREKGKKESIYVSSISDMDSMIEQLKQSAESAPSYTESQSARGQILKIQAIRTSIKTRCLHYVTSLERQLKTQEKPQAFLIQAQTEVNNYFKTRSEQVYVKLQKAAELVISTKDTEDSSLLFTEVRRSIEAVADHFYPPVNKLVECSDGVERNLGDKEHLNRLQEYLARNFGKSSSSDLLKAEYKSLVALVRRLNDSASKGLHKKATVREAKQGLIVLYMFLYNLISLPQEKSQKK